MPEYYNVTTNLGDAEIANAIATNTKLNITHIAFGDGNGSVPTPNKARTSLVREVHRQAVNKYTQHPTITKWLTVEAIIPSNIGGFWIREIGVIADNVLISHGSHAPFFKVADTEGVSEYRLKFTIDIQDASIVQLTLDESLIYATQAWIDENYIPRSEIVDNLTTNDATKVASARTVKELQDNKLEAIDLNVVKDSLSILDYCPIPYPKSTPPTGYLAMMGQAISESTYPKLYALYGAVLPDMRAYSVRGLDYGRGIDVGRSVLSQQEDAIQNIKGSLKAGSQYDRNTQFIDSLVADGAFSVLAGDKTFTGEVSGWGQAWGTEFDASRVVRTSTETRMKNVAFLYIVKAG